MGTSYQTSIDQHIRIIIYSYANNNTVEFAGDIRSFSDSFVSNVSSEPIYGRIDPIKTYSGTTRDISFSVLIDSTTENNQYFEKVAAVSSMMYPIYSSTDQNMPSILKAPPLFAVKIAPILVGGTSLTDVNEVEHSELLPGFFTNYSINYDTSKGVELQGSKKVPREITLNFSFSPLHDRQGGFGEDNKEITSGWPF